MVKSQLNKKSDWLVNGDKADDRDQIELRDSEDPVVKDNGFALASDN